MEIVCNTPTFCKDRRAKYCKLVQSAGRARERDTKVLQAKLQCKQARLHAFKQQSDIQFAGGCEPCSMLQAQAFGQGIDTWYKRRCSKCWQEHARQHSQQALWIQQHRSQYVQARQQHEAALPTPQSDEPQPMSLRCSTAQHTSVQLSRHEIQCTEASSINRSSRLLDALDLTVSTESRAKTHRTATRSQTQRTARQHPPTPEQQPIEQQGSSTLPANATAKQENQMACAAAGSQSMECTCIAAGAEDDKWESAAAVAVAHELAAMGLPATALVSGSGVWEAGKILTVLSAADLTHGTRNATQLLHNTTAQHNSTLQYTNDSTDHRPPHLNSVPASAAVISKFPVVPSRSKNGNASSNSSCLPAWQRKLHELEAACKQAEQDMIHGASLAERKAALELAVELREDIARIRQANRVHLKLQRTLQLKQGSLPAQAFGSTVGIKVQGSEKGRKPLIGSVDGTAVAAAANLRASTVTQGCKEPGAVQRAVGELMVSDYNACKQLPIDAWRQRRKKEATWKAVLKQQLAKAPL